MVSMGRVMSGGVVRVLGSNTPPAVGGGGGSLHVRVHGGDLLPVSAGGSEEVPPGPGACVSGLSPVGQASRAGQDRPAMAGQRHGVQVTQAGAAPSSGSFSSDLACEATLVCLPLVSCLLDSHRIHGQSSGLSESASNKFECFI